MSIFDRIKHAIFRNAAAAPATPASTAPGQASQPAAPVNPASPSAPAAASPAVATPAPEAAATPARQATESAAGATATQPAVPSQPVDIEPILDAAVKSSGQKLDWRRSIVDLMKALGMDASLEERKQLAGELGYGGDMHDSAKMNMFLHKALMKKLSENGGKVPADLLG